MRAARLNLCNPREELDLPAPKWTDSARCDRQGRVMSHHHGVRPGQSRSKACLASVGVASVLALALCGCTPKSTSQAQSSTPQATAEKSVLSSNLDQIQNQYAADAASARNKYEKVAVQFTAVAGEVDAASAHDLTVNFQTAQHPQPIRAIFPKTTSETRSPVKRGDLVQARCNKVGEVAGKPELQDCAFR